MAAPPVALASIALPAFAERLPWLGGDLQTVRNRLVRWRFPRPAATTSLILEMRDGSGDRLVVFLDRPAMPRGPPVVLVHGLTGCAQSGYMLATAVHFLGLGHPVLRLDLRGAGASRALCRERYHAGRSADLRDALAALPAELAEAGVFMIGYSLGANMLLKLLGEGPGGAVLAAAAVSPPIDLAAASRRIRMPRNVIYHRYLLSRMKAELMAGPHSPAERTILAEVDDLYAFDDRLVAPAAGFAGADDYYARSSAAGFLPAIAVPTLVVHATNDPWIPPDAFRSFDWPANPRLLPATLPGGGHVGFHGRGSTVPWHDRAAAAFFAAVAPEGSR